uniref:Type II protein arginine methyltransferase n=1 Tax=Candidatus Kentrum sp. MB TaxID=2138164 RepID=A0A450XYS2_9GAMM|nr:MAG: type II protein arginine methyltransferase [Candidatus Kentron sp. MB]VFK76759.1 MAG: type II protein arginine methyltransferase [Candidatus Kentron sp. MB]
MAQCYDWHNTSDPIGMMHHTLEKIAQNLEEKITEGEATETERLDLNRIYQQLIARWHFPMLNNPFRAGLFEQALEKVDVKDKVVLDIGSGTGLLAMMAARQGARSVVSCELNGVLANLAEQIVAKNGYRNTVTIVNAVSTDPKVLETLPEPADVIVTEIVDQGLVGENIINTLKHARQELLKPNGTIIPWKGRLYGQCVESSVMHGLNHVNETTGFDVSLFNKFSIRGHFPVGSEIWPHTYLSDPFLIYDFDFMSYDLAAKKNEMQITTTNSGTLHGVIIWFELELADGIIWSNAPAHLATSAQRWRYQESHQSTAIATFSEASKVAKGEIMKMIFDCENNMVTVDLL